MAIGAAFGAGAIGSILGGIAGAQGNQGRQTQTTSVNLRDMAEINEGEGELASAARQSQMGQFGELESLLTQGGMAQASGDINAARSEALNFAGMLRDAQAGPNEAQIARAQNFAQDIFAPQQQALQQSFQQSETETARLAARLGRSVDDPILRAKLAERQAEQTAGLQARQGAFTAQSAQQFQNDQLVRQQQLSGVREGLASQALRNRQALLGMGQSILQQERNFRLQTAGRTTDSRNSSGGGVAGAIGGALAGAGAGLGAVGTFNSLSGGGGGAGAMGAGQAAAMGVQDAGGASPVFGFDFSK